MFHVKQDLIYIDMKNRKKDDLRIKMVVLSFYNLLRLKKAKGVCSLELEVNRRFHISNLCFDLYIDMYDQIPLREELEEMYDRCLFVNELLIMSGEVIVENLLINLED